MAPVANGGVERTGVGETALGAAMMRAEEATRRDRLFDDPLAALFLAAAPDPFPDGPDPDDPEIAALKDAFQTNVAIRTRFYDEFLRSAVHAGCRQVVLLAAGLDTRAFRLDWPRDVRLFELDLPEVLSFKNGVLADSNATPRCTRIPVAVDLREDWPAVITQAGIDTRQPVAWTVEGLLAYLTDADAVRLLARVSDLSSQASRLALETARAADDATLSRAGNVEALEQIATMWQGGPRRDPGEWLAERGWHVERLERAALAQAYGRPIADQSTGGFLTATKALR
jgi:methyltransferase (TIGR00027 family)